MPKIVAFNRIEGVTEAVLVGVYDDSVHDEKVYFVIQGDNLIFFKNTSKLTN